MSDEQHPEISELLELVTANDTKQKQIEILAKEKQTLWDRIDELSKKLELSQENLRKITEERDYLKQKYADYKTHIEKEYLDLRKACKSIVYAANFHEPW